MKTVRAAIGATMLMAASAALADADTAAMRGYALTMPKLQHYHQAMLALQSSRDPAVEAEMPALDGLMNGSIAAAMAKLHKAPHVQGAIRQAGLTDDDFLLIPMVTIAASIATAASPSEAASMPVSAANIAFVKQHQAELRALKMTGDD